ncbi:MAG: YeiH family putative sulfate export transporter [Chlamydiae bacterium]|nr:YeiH family putative sulfate export transporter [Chlamydiota bacterium]
MPFSKKNITGTVNGIVFVFLFALSSLYIVSIPLLAEYGISSLMVAIVLGIFYGNTLHHQFPQDWSRGLHFCSKRLLRLAIILYGFRVNFQQLFAVGLQGLVLDVLIVFSTILLGWWIGSKLFKLDSDLSLLVGVGSGICGAAAVLAMEDVVKSQPFKATIAVATVVVFGTLSMFIYPILQQSDVFGFTPQQFGVFSGASVHEVAQVIVSGSAISQDVATTAIVVKMLRVILLVPVLLICAMFFKGKIKGKVKQGITIPWFALGFLAVIGLNSMRWIPVGVVAIINQIDILFLTMAMGSIGIETSINKIKQVGCKPFYLAGILFFWLTGSAYLMIKYF